MSAKNGGAHNPAANTVSGTSEGAFALTDVPGADSPFYEQREKGIMAVKDRAKNEKGAVMIVEATFVFPIMFFVVFFMIMVGEAYYQEARVEKIVQESTLRAAVRIGSPLMQYAENHDGSLPTDPNTASLMPYRYILTGNAREVCEAETKRMTEEIGDYKGLIFSQMGARPEAEPVVQPDMRFLVEISRVKSTCKFSVRFPIRMIFSSKDIEIKYNVAVQQSVEDPSEVIRDVSMVKDLVERNEQADEFAKKIVNLKESGFFKLIN